MDILAERRARDAERKRRKRAEERKKKLSATVSALCTSEDSPACETAAERTETAIVAREEVNPYKDYPLSIPELLRAILCEIWEVRQCLTRK